MNHSQSSLQAQGDRNKALIDGTKFMRDRVESSVLPFSIDLSADGLTDEQKIAINALEKESAALH